MRSAALLLFALTACPSPAPGVDAGVDAGTRDAGAEDAGAADAGVEPLPEYGTRTIFVRASTYWTSTGLYLAPGESVTLSATGMWTGWTGSSPLHGPAGIGTQMVDGCPWASLVASIDLPYQQKWQCVGTSETLTAPADAGGILYLGAADYTLEDNSGGMTVTVTSAGAQAPTLDAGQLGEAARVTAPMLELESEHVLLALPSELVRKHAATAAEGLALFDALYARHEALAGATPYSGQRIRFVPDVRIRPFGYMLAGNPIRLDPVALDGAPPRENILQSADTRFSIWGFAHELGHDFTFINSGRYMIGRGPVEAWANVFTLHALEALGHPEMVRAEICAGVPAYLASGDYSQFSADPWLPLCMLLELKTAHGWPLFQTFFSTYNAMDASTVPGDTAPDGMRWAWVRDRLNAISGRDTTATFTKYKVPLQ